MSIKLKHVLPAVFAAILLLCAGCGTGGAGSGGSGAADQSTYEKIQAMLVGLTSFKSEADVEYKSNKGSNLYETVQQCKISGEYRIDVTGPKKVSGNVTVSDGKTICQFNSAVSGRVSVAKQENQERSEILLINFIKNYLNSQEVSISVTNMADSQCTVLEATIPGNHPYISSEKLWVDNKTLKPVLLTIYDPQGSERIIVTYKSFEYNVALEDSVFKV